jgi:type VI secretion system protein ImpK
MRPELMELVYPFIAQTLDLAQRLRQSPNGLDLPTEQTALVNLLGNEAELQRLSAVEQITVSPRKTERFLGVRYALVSWVDELFIVDSPWSQLWNERKLEGMIYRTNDRAWRFWEQAQLAMTQEATDALEVFYLCVMLGFRGEYREQPDLLNQWVVEARRRLVPPNGVQWSQPVGREPPSGAEPLRGANRLALMIVLACVLLLVVIPLATFWLVSRITQT